MELSGRQVIPALRVLYVHHAPMLGGAEASLLCLLRHLPPAEVAAILACPPGGFLEQPGAAGRAEWCEVAALVPQWSRNPVPLARQALQLCRMGQTIRGLARRYQVNLIHANSWPSALASVLGAAGAWPIVWHVRDLRIPPLVTAALRTRCAAAVAISAAVRNLLLSRRFPADRIHLVYNGLDLAELRPVHDPSTIRASLGLDPQAPLIVSVAHLVPWKRHDLLLHAARLIIQRIPAARFLFVGGETPQNPGLRAALQEQARELGLAAAVTFLGYRDDVVSIVNACDVFIHAATHEPMGRAILEAMGLGRPVVVPRAAGPAELVEHEVSGLLVTPGSAQALAEGALPLLTNPELAARLGRNSRRRVEVAFSAEAMARGVIAVYRQVFGRT